MDNLKKHFYRVCFKLKLFCKLLPIICTSRGWDRVEGEDLLIAYLELLRDNLKSEKASLERAEFKAYQIDKWLQFHRSVMVEENYIDYSLPGDQLYAKELKARQTLWRIYATYNVNWWD